MVSSETRNTAKAGISWMSVAALMPFGDLSAGVGSPVAAAQPPDSALIRSTPLEPESLPEGTTRFTRLAPETTGLDLVHEFPANGSFTLLQDQGAGAGVCVGDFDADGLPDVFVSNYNLGNRLYRNLGDWRFADVTARAGVAAAGSWCGGATAADLDNDGDLDLCVSVFNGPNLVFINRGDGTFQEEASERGLDFSGASVMTAFADYDRDGDLDAYLVTHRLSIGADHRLPRNAAESRSRGIVQLDSARRPTISPRYRELFALADKGGGRFELYIAGQSDHLFRNLGNGHFENVSAAAGIRGCEIGLAANWWDYNTDGLPDLYVSNDYKGPDRLWRNNGDGTFDDVARGTLPHVPWSSMGADSADINNDGRIDFFATEMAGSTRRRRMTIIDDLRERWFLQASVPRQYLRNAVYLATGTERLMEIAYLTGLAATDWTWSPKFGDFDNDGWVDLFIANGMTRDFLNADLLSRMRERGNTGWRKMPVLRETNLVFRNLGDLRFESTGEAWGLNQLAASMGSAVADLDRDGDLDLIVMNYGEPLSLFRNDSRTGHRVLIRLKGLRSNSWGVGATVRIATATGELVRCLCLASGFMSANEPLVHFGLGGSISIRELTVHWPSGQVQSFADLPANQFYTITEPSQVASQPTPTRRPSLFVRSETGAGLRHREKTFDDFQREELLPWKLSQLGPGLAVGDVNGDGADDLFLGGATGYAGLLGLRQAEGRFQIRSPECLARDRSREDMGALLLDTDGDGDQDLYVVSGGAEYEPGDPRFHDRLYLNDGDGNFSEAPDGTLPDLRDSGSVAAAADFDRDGDLDLFIGGRCVPGRYPWPADSRLLINHGGRFRDRTEVLAPALLGTGLVTSAVWSDTNDDGWIDLVVTHEWGPVKCFLNERGRLADRTRDAGLAERLGWWNGIAAGDVDNDGDIDYAVTNLGLNTRYRATPDRPAVAFRGVFDDSDQAHFIEAAYEGDILYPLRSLDVLASAIPALRERFPSHRGFARAALDEVFTAAHLQAAERFTVDTLESGILLNDGQARFKFRPLPRLAQASPGFGVTLTDSDTDGQLDLYVVQNSYGPQPETGRMDGGLSLLLSGNGDGTFTPVWPDDSGLVVPEDAKSLAVTEVNGDGSPDFVVGVNDGQTRVFESQPPEDSRRLNVQLLGKPGNPTGVGARVKVIAADGSAQVAEVHAGGGYLSQSSPTLSFGLGSASIPVAIEVRWPAGTTTKMLLQGKQQSVRIEQ